MSDQNIPVDPEQVIARLEAQVGSMYGQIVRLQVALAEQVKRNVEADNTPPPDER